MLAVIGFFLFFCLFKVVLFLCVKVVLLLLVD